MWLLVWAGLTFAATFRGDMARTGVGDGSTLVNNRIAWQRRVGDRLLWPMSPVVSAGVVLVGTADGHLRAFTVEGAPLWDVALGGPVAAPPTVDGQDVYAVDGAGGLWALTLGSGAVRWHQAVARGRIVGAPAVSDGFVVYQGLDRVVRVVRSADGTSVWEKTLDGAAEGAPTVADGRVYLATADRKLRAWALADGKPLWDADLGGASRATVAVAGGLAIVGAKDGVLRAFDAVTGAARWQYTAGGFLDSSPAAGSGSVYVGSSTGTLHAVALRTGKPRWTYVAGSAIGSSPTLSGDAVIVGSTGGVVHVVDTGTGRATFQLGVGAPVEGAPSIVDGRAFVATLDGRVIAIGEPAFVALPPTAQRAVVLAVDAPMWFGRRLFLGALGQVLVGAGDAASFLVGDEAGLLRSADGGLSWSTVALPGDEKIRQVVSVAAKAVRAVTEASIVESADGGLSWKRVGDAPAAWGAARRRVQGRGKTRLALGEENLLASADGGLTWTTLAPPGAPRSAAVHPLNPAVLLVGGADGDLWRTADGGLQWEVLGRAPQALVALDINEKDPARVLGAGDDGALVRSADGGLTWTVVAGAAGSPARSLRWVPGSASRAYAALADGRVFATGDGGLRWAEVRYGLPEDQPITDISLDIAADGGILVAVRLADGGGGAYRLGKVADHSRLESVTFATASAELGASANPVFDKLFARMQADPTLRLRAEGHTDDVGADEDNLVLSVARAKAVAAAAEARGVAASRVLTFGYGESRAITGNETEDGRAQNRRVELYLVRLP
ncbi:MAG: PQQ-binding-like beta-propeller repeat protein [Pseudomonadota bacterium]|nr:PQQ-binding-like beta-propeller repeat protein [Pseudomonadota bacterium]